MKRIVTTLTIAACALAFAGSAWSADEAIIGKWKAQFDSQIGQQKYTFEFKMEGTNLVGRAMGERQMGTNDVAVTGLKIDKDEVSFVEPLKLQDNEIQIEYKGKIAGDELKLHRKVGDLAEYDIVAKRVKEGGTDSKGAASTNSPPAKTD
jgi:hypothetical protein